MKLTENLVLGKSRASDLENVRKLNCWGSELTDVSIIRKMPNVQVVSLSVNKISSLRDFASCVNLEELYIRKNEIKELREIRHLKKLPKLTKLWLSDNPCADVDKYRMTVLKFFPNLQKLDNTNVTEDEVNQALDEGIDLDLMESGDQQQPIKEALAEGVVVADDSTVNSASNQIKESTSNGETEEKVDTEGEENGTEDNQPSAACSLPTGLKQARQNPVMISWDETNKIRQQLGLKPLPVEKVTQLKPRTTSTAKSRNSNLLQAALHLVKELDAESLETLAEAVRNRLETLY